MRAMFMNGFFLMDRVIPSHFRNSILFFQFGINVIILVGFIVDIYSKELLNFLKYLIYHHLQLTLRFGLNFGNFEFIRPIPFDENLNLPAVFLLRAEELRTCRQDERNSRNTAGQSEGGHHPARVQGGRLHQVCFDFHFYIENFFGYTSLKSLRQK